ncbi:lysine 2,3-aminomutase [Rhodococcus sp. 05-2255-3B1]|nr:lysine 2,3-aminomutase [Rhodococcus sp. 05-2255-3C]OZE15929.1 lysine 2,3-aminomutase [Rhodococcus sp. 05-2255-3B1]OZE18968.1 lysine 2,3-aminomutase [Rhodococcus sp. 05-2255-2A2]
MRETISTDEANGVAGQPVQYVRKELVEPDWCRFPGFRTVTAQQWRDPQWQRAHCIKNARQLRDAVGGLLTDGFYEDLAADQDVMATMSMLLPPHMLNTMVPTSGMGGEDPGEFTEAFYRDPVRLYMMPVLSDRDLWWPDHPYASRDSLHEAEMWVTEGLTHRYPTKVLAELVSTCPQYCGHCTRMDLVGNSTPQIEKTRFVLKPVDRQSKMIDYIRQTKHVRDVVVSGGDVANVPWLQLESFLMQLLEIDSVRDIRLASKALAGLPQHWLQSKVIDGMERVAKVAEERGVNLALHTHINNVQSVTPLVAEAARAMLAVGVRDVRNQGVLMRGVNSTSQGLLDLCFAMQDDAGILPYYFYMCDMIPNSEHWRVPVWEARELQRSIMGYLPGYATPRIVCDVPYVGKCWVDQVVDYDRVRGISYWSKNYSTPLERTNDGVTEDQYVYYDPISSLSSEGKQWWMSQQQSSGVA